MRAPQTTGQEGLGLARLRVGILTCYGFCMNHAEDGAAEASGALLGRILTLGGQVEGSRADTSACSVASL